MALAIKPSKTVIALCLAGGIIGGAVYGFPLLLKNRLAKTLESYGLQEPVITGLDHRRGEVMFTDIYLDSDKFSKIGSVRARLNWPGLFFSSRPFSQLIIDDLNLMLAFPQDIYDWQNFDPSSLLLLTGTDDIILNGASLDLITDEGALNFKLKGHINTPAVNSHTAVAESAIRKKTLNAVLWANQYQTIIDSQWHVDVYADKSWRAATETKDLRLKFDTLSLSRASGWATIENMSPEKENRFSEIAGQYQAGSAQIGHALQISDLNLSFKGTQDNLHCILTATSSSYPSVTLAAEAIYNAAIIEDIQVNLSTTSLDDLFEFVISMKDSLQDITSFGNSMTSLLITPGNLERIRKELSGNKYDSLTMIISGTTYNLNGQIIAEQHTDNTRKQVKSVSMNPGDTEQIP